MGRTVAENSPQVSRPCLLRLQALHEALARGLETALGTLLRAEMRVKLTGMEQLTYGQFVYNVAAPTCFYVFRTDPPAERVMLDIESPILLAMIDRLLGGSTDEPPPADQPLGEIELCLAGRIVQTFLDAYHAAWEAVYDLRLDVLQVETDPRSARLLPADEMVVVADLEATIGRTTGMLRLCLPGRMIEQLQSQLLRYPTAPDQLASGESLAELTVALAETTISSDELAELRPGDIIVTETPVDAGATVSLDGRQICRGKAGIYQGRKAVQISELLPPNG